MNEKQKQTILDLPKVIAVGIAAPVATILTSRFGVAGTLIGLAVSAVILTALADILKVYLARAPATVSKIPGSLRPRLSWRNMRGRLRAAFTRFSALPPVRRRSILIGSLVAAGISFFVGLSIVTALELGVGKSLSCWVWNNCPTESSTDDGKTSTMSTLPSILGGGRSVSSVASEIQAPSSQQPTPGTPGAPSQPEGVPSSEQPSSLQPGQRWSPSAAPEEDQQPSSSDASDEDEQQSGPVDESEGDQQQEDQTNQPSSGSDRETPEPTIPPDLFTT